MTLTATLVLYLQREHVEAPRRRPREPERRWHCWPWPGEAASWGSTAAGSEARWRRRVPSRCHPAGPEEREDDVGYRPASRAEPLCWVARQNVPLEPSGAGWWCLTGTLLRAGVRAELLYFSFPAHIDHGNKSESEDRLESLSREAAGLPRGDAVRGGWGEEEVGVFIPPASRASG